MPTFDFKLNQIEQYLIYELDDMDDHIFFFNDDDEIECNDLFRHSSDICFVDTEREAISWCNNDLMVFKKLVEEVKEYEEEEYGRTETDFTFVSSVVNMYVWIVIQEMLPKMLEERYKKEVEEILDELLKKNEKSLIDKVVEFLNFQLI